jgi:hypothetical protein
METGSGGDMSSFVGFTNMTSDDLRKTTHLDLSALPNLRNMKEVMTDLGMPSTTRNTKASKARNFNDLDRSSTLVKHCKNMGKSLLRKIYDEANNSVLLTDFAPPPAISKFNDGENLMDDTIVFDDSISHETKGLTKDFN